MKRVDERVRLARFEQEMDYLDRAGTYPGIAPIHDRGVHQWLGNSYPFFVSTYYPLTLKTVLATRVPDFCTSLLFTVQLLGALRHLSTMNVVHRDIKPGNVFLSGYRVILGDFGLAKSLRASEGVDEVDVQMLTESQDVPEPWSYRTPDIERYMRHRIELTVRADVFQVGLVASQLFHAGSNPEQWARRKLDPIVLAPQRPAPGQFGGEVEEVLSEMLRDDSEQRIDASGALARFLGILDRALRAQYSAVGDFL